MKRWFEMVVKYAALVATCAFLIGCSGPTPPSIPVETGFAQISVTVTDQAGNPLAGADVSIQSPDALGPRVLTTDSKGRATALISSKCCVNLSIMKISDAEAYGPTIILALPPASDVTVPVAKAGGAAFISGIVETAGLSGSQVVHLTIAAASLAYYGNFPNLVSMPDYVDLDANTNLFSEQCGGIPCAVYTVEVPVAVPMVGQYDPDKQKIVFSAPLVPPESYFIEAFADNCSQLSLATPEPTSVSSANDASNPVVAPLLEFSGCK